MHDRLLAEEPHLDDATLAKHAMELGLNMKRFASAPSDARIDNAIKDDIALAAKIGARATPSLFINGRPLGGALTDEDLAAAIEAELHADTAPKHNGAAANVAGALQATHLAK